MARESLSPKLLLILASDNQIDRLILCHLILDKFSQIQTNVKTHFTLSNSFHETEVNEIHSYIGTHL